MSDHGLSAAAPWRRWRMDELQGRQDALPQDPAARREHQRLFQQQSELRALREQAREAAHREGLEAGLAEGRETGYREGLEEGRRSGEAEFDARRRELLEPLVPLAEGLRQALEQFDDDLADSLVDVALAAGRRLAGDALTAQPEQVRTLIQGLLREEPLFSGSPRLWLHPDDLALVDAALSEELDAAGWATQADDTLSRGGCRVTGPEGELDATREQRWEALLARSRRQQQRHSHGDDREPQP